MAQKLFAFIAKSFDPGDEAKIAPIVSFIGSFDRLGFFTRSAERSEVESVSQKVRSLIDKSDVFVGIFTRKHPIYHFDGAIRTAFAVLRSTLKPVSWSASPWVLQESGYAIKSKKDLILFQELGVEIPGLQGDLEYIPFDPQNPVPALQRASEMINALIAKAASISVETVVQSGISERKDIEVVAPAEQMQAEAEPKEDSIVDNINIRILELWKVAKSRDWEKSRQQYEDGLNWIREHDQERELFWNCFYQKTLFTEGRADALDQLRDLAEENEDEYLPWSFLAVCYVDLGEYDEAVKYYLHAAAIAKPGDRALLEVNAAETLAKSKKVHQARELLLELRISDYAKEPKLQFRILKNLYSLWESSEDKFDGFAIAELALHQCPEESSFRYSLALDYDSADQAHLSAYHNEIICKQDNRNSGALNNLGIAFAKCGLPVLAVQRYKQSYSLGDTIAASNLGRKYLDSGLTEDAISLLKAAQSIENCSSEVGQTLAAVHEKIEENSRGEEKVLEQAKEHRDFLLSFAVGLLAPSLANLDGRWVFPLVEIDLKCAMPALDGIKENRSEVNPGLGVSTLLGGSDPKPTIRIERFEFSGIMSGRTCKFKLEMDKHDEPESWRLLGGPVSSTIEGYILFSEDGGSGQVAESRMENPTNTIKFQKLRESVRTLAH